MNWKMREFENDKAMATAQVKKYLSQVLYLKNLSEVLQSSLPSSFPPLPSSFPPLSSSFPPLPSPSPHLPSTLPFPPLPPVSSSSSSSSYHLPLLPSSESEARVSAVHVCPRLRAEGKWLPLFAARTTPPARCVASREL